MTNSQRGGNVLAYRAVCGVNICVTLATAAKASGLPGRLSKALDSGIHMASPLAQVQQNQGVLVTAVFVLAEVGVKSQAGQVWGRGKSQEWIY